jgi:hypothetical protein
MNLYEKIKTIYPSLTQQDFMSVISLQLLVRLHSKLTNKLVLHRNLNINNNEHKRLNLHGIS